MRQKESEGESKAEQIFLKRIWNFVNYGGIEATIFCGTEKFNFRECGLVSFGERKNEYNLLVESILEVNEKCS